LPPRTQRPQSGRPPRGQHSRSRWHCAQTASTPRQSARGRSRLWQVLHSGWSVRANHAGPSVPQREHTATGFVHGPIFQRLMFSRR
jgi:hypothetical protein